MQDRFLSKSFPPTCPLNARHNCCCFKDNDYLVQSSKRWALLVFISIVMAFMFEKIYIICEPITNLIPIFTVLGILSWLGISIRPPTAMTFSVALELQWMIVYISFKIS